jgi:putative transport protein
LNATTYAVLMIALVAVTGLLAGGVRIRGIGLGPAGVLFAGLLFGHFGVRLDHNVAGFAKEFGLILFVFTIGIQLGPGIVELWRRQGLLLNGLVLAMVVQSVLLVVAAHYFLGIPAIAVAGLFSGATTNTPSLGAAEQAAVMGTTAAGTTAAGEAIHSLTTAYAISYPGGIVGIIAAMVLIRRWFRIDVAREAAEVAEQEQQRVERIERRSIVLDNPHLDGMAFGGIPGVEETGVRLSRIQRQGEAIVHPATDETILHTNDVIQVVGSQAGLDRFTPLIGRRSQLDLMTAAGDAEFRRVFVTNPDVLNRSLAELSLDHVYNVTVTRIARGEVEMTARGGSRFHYGDIAHVVGDRESLEMVTRLLGNSNKALKETPFSPLFFGIAVGVSIGMAPLSIPGVPFPVRLGFAGGSLLAAIAFSLVGSIGRFVWYTPYAANLALRELGIILFLASTGIGAGAGFAEAAFSAVGLKWMLTGLVVTMVPLVVTAVIARRTFRMDYLTICGLIAGGMTDPPALAFANSMSDSSAPATAYAAVYPLAMILRILSAQALVLALL